MGKHKQSKLLWEAKHGARQKTINSAKRFWRDKNKSKSIVFTKHAIERCTQAGIDEQTAEQMIMKSTYYPLSDMDKIHKGLKYGAKFQRMEYAHYERKYLFSLLQEEDKIVVLTVTKNPVML